MTEKKQGRPKVDNVRHNFQSNREALEQAKDKCGGSKVLNRILSDIVEQIAEHDNFDLHLKGTLTRKP